MNLQVLAQLAKETARLPVGLACLPNLPLFEAIRSMKATSCSMPEQSSLSILLDPTAEEEMTTAAALHTNIDPEQIRPRVASSVMADSRNAWLSTGSVAKMLGFRTTQGVRDFARRTGLPTYRHGRRWFINAGDLERHVRSGEVPQGCGERSCTSEEGERYGSEVERTQEDETSGRAQGRTQWSVPVAGSTQMLEDRKGSGSVTLVNGGDCNCGGRRKSPVPGGSAKRRAQRRREKTAGDPFGLRRALDSAEEE